VWYVSSLVKGAFSSRKVIDSSMDLPLSITNPKGLFACTTGMQRAPWLTWCQSVNGKRQVFRVSVQNNQTLTSLAGIDRLTATNYIFFLAYVDEPA